MLGGRRAAHLPCVVTNSSHLAALAGIGPLTVARVDCKKVSMPCPRHSRALTFHTFHTSLGPLGPRLKGIEWVQILDALVEEEGMALKLGRKLCRDREAANRGWKFVLIARMSPLLPLEVKPPVRNRCRWRSCGQLDPIFVPLARFSTTRVP